MVRRQEARAEELIERQNTRCTEIEQRQLETQAVVENLREDLATVKEVLNSRIQATETELAGLEGTRQRMTAELHATKTEILDNMMAELETRFATKDQLGTALSTRTLRPGAPEFVSSLCPSVGFDTITPPGRGSQLQKPPPFDGHSPWDAYKL